MLSIHGEGLSNGLACDSESGFVAPAVESASGPAPELSMNIEREDKDEQGHMSRGFSEHPIASGPVRAVTVLLFTALVFYGLWRGTVHLVQWIRIH